MAADQKTPEAITRTGGITSGNWSNCTNYFSWQKTNSLRWSFADESAFNLAPDVPYAWQPPGEYQKIVSRPGENLNVLGFMTKSNQLEIFTKEGSIDAQFVMNIMYAFVAKL